MLQEMRHYTKSWFAWIFVIPLAVSFVAWGVNDMFRPSAPDTVATVGGKDISYQQFQQQYQNAMRELGLRRNKILTADDARAMGLGKAVLDEMTADAALDTMASHLGLSVSDSEVTGQIRGMREFAGPLGTFDKGTFDRDIETLGFTEQSFLAYMKGALAQQQLKVPVQAAFVTPGPYVSALIASEAEARAVSYFVITPTMLAAIPPPSDAVLQAYLQAHANQFSTPEYRDVTLAYIAPEDVMNEVNVTPEQIKQQYDANASTYNVPEQRELEQLSFNSQADAAAAKKKLDSGMSFAQLATSLGKKPSDIAIGTLAQKDLPDARGAAAFAVQEGGVTAPVQNSFGWYLLHVTKVIPGKSTSLEQATPDIRKSLLQQTAAAKVADMMNAAQDSLGTGAEIQEVAAKSGMKYVHVAAMDRNGLGPDGKPVAVPNDDQLHSEIFKAEVGEYGDPEQTKSGLAFVIKVNGVTPPKLKPLNTVRDQVLAAWMAEKQAQLLREKANAIAAEAHDQPSFARAAQAAGATPKPSPALLRSTSDSTFSHEFVQNVFDARPGSTAVGPTGDGKSYVVALVTGVRHGSIAPQAPLFQRVRANVSGQMGTDAAQAFAAAAKAKQGVTIHPDVVNRVTGGENS